jgi:tetratricopeptide (TPR) repeat protein
MHMLASYGEAQLANGDLSAANEFCRQCLEAATITESKKYLARGWRLKAELAKASLRWEDASTALDQSLAFASNIGNPTQLWRTYLARAEVLKMTGKTNESEAAYRAASRTIGDIGASLSRPELKALFEGSTLFESVRSQIVESR